MAKKCSICSGDGCHRCYGTGFVQTPKSMGNLDGHSVRVIGLSGPDADKVRNAIEAFNKMKADQRDAKRAEGKSNCAFCMSWEHEVADCPRLNDDPHPWSEICPNDQISDEKAARLNAETEEWEARQQERLDADMSYDHFHPDTHEDS